MHRRNYKDRSLSSRQSSIDNRHLPKFARRKKGLVLAAAIALIGHMPDASKLRSGSLAHLAPELTKQYA